MITNMKETFQSWYKRLKNHMAQKEDHAGIPLDPDDFSESEAWNELFSKGMTIDEAFLDQC